MVNTKKVPNACGHCGEAFNGGLDEQIIFVARAYVIPHLRDGMATVMFYGGIRARGHKLAYHRKCYAEKLQ